MVRPPHAQAQALVQAKVSTYGPSRISLLGDRPSKQRPVMVPPLRVAAAVWLGLGGAAAHSDQVSPPCATPNLSTKIIPAKIA